MSYFTLGVDLWYKTVLCWSPALTVATVLRHNPNHRNTLITARGLLRRHGKLIKKKKVDVNDMHRTAVAARRHNAI